MIVEISIIRESFLTCNLTLKSNLHMIECVENLIPADPIGSYLTQMHMLVCLGKKVRKLMRVRVVNNRIVVAGTYDYKHKIIHILL